MKNVKCNCEGWVRSANQIFSAQIIVSQRGFEYTGDIFKYCPWCGRDFTATQQSAEAETQNMRCVCPDCGKLHTHFDRLGKSGMGSA